MMKKYKSPALIKQMAGETLSLQEHLRAQIPGHS